MYDFLYEIPALVGVGLFYGVSNVFNLGCCIGLQARD